MGTLEMDVLGVGARLDFELILSKFTVTRDFSQTIHEEVAGKKWGFHEGLGLYREMVWYV